VLRVRTYLIEVKTKVISKEVTGMRRVENQCFPIESWYGSYSITHCRAKLKIPHFRGVFCGNELPYKVNVDECGIINLDDSRGMGTHWCCWLKRGRVKYYFDSFGLQPPNEIVQYLKTGILYSTDRIQPDGTLQYVGICASMC
jgi:hypothetical protein